MVLLFLAVLVVVLAGLPGDVIFSMRLAASVPAIMSAARRGIAIPADEDFPEFSTFLRKPKGQAFGLGALGGLLLLGLLRRRRRRRA
ncbi:MAG: hypothetical protein M4D80_33675 [Myxococcota bacterium]|nr:hypothetical protein [Deltaproteobacteria bacterium]MDQ3340135.1 hypothetical protein [Myxococcota bacterium]